MEKVSAVIITLNEEKNIERCLNSLIGLADEIIVIDSFSTDSTPQICKNLPIRFEQHKWMGYSQTKNFGNQLASYDYILSLDADEEISPELRSSILSAKKLFTFDAYRFNRRTNYCGKWINHSGWYPDSKIRLWNKRRGEWLGDIHESVVLDHNCKIGFLKGNLLHFSFFSINEHLNQISKFSSIKADSWFAQGKKTNLWKMFWSPFFKFFRDFIIRGGFRDGILGFIICANSAHSRFIFQSKLWMLTHQSRGKTLK
jgi:glycosyltransferase involved in cell wall biosynthesis